MPSDRRCVDSDTVAAAATPVTPFGALGAHVDAAGRLYGRVEVIRRRPGAQRTLVHVVE